MRLAAWIGSFSIVTVLIGAMLMPVLNFFSFLLINGYVVAIPAAFYASAGFRSWMDAWLRRKDHALLFRSSILACLGLGFHLYLALVLDKIMALGSAKALA
jgi:hypothetical protein